MFCPQRRVQPLQLRGGFSLNPMSALSESAVSGTPGRARVCQTLLGAGPWETPNLTPQKANKTVEICNFLCVFVRSWHPPGSSSTWGHQLAEGASNHQCFCPWCLVCDLVLGAWPLQWVCWVDNDERISVLSVLPPTTHCLGSDAQRGWVTCLWSHSKRGGEWDLNRDRSRYEAKYLSGIAHFLEKLAFSVSVQLVIFEAILGKNLSRFAFLKWIF